MRGGEVGEWKEWFPARGLSALRLPTADTRAHSVITGAYTFEMGGGEKRQKDFQSLCRNYPFGVTIWAWVREDILHNVRYNYGFGGAVDGGAVL